MATRDRYIASGESPEDFERTVNFAMRSIADRLDRQEGIRGFPFIPQDTIQFGVGDTRPSVKDHNIFSTKNVEATTITHFVDGYAGQSIDIFFGDNLTTMDFSSGNLRTNWGVNWSVTQDQYLHAVYDSTKELWYCSAWDAAAVFGSSSIATRWQFVEFSGDRTCVVTDAFKMLKSTGAAAQTATIPPMSDVAWVKGDQISFYQYGAGALTVAAGTGVTINTPSTLIVNEQYGTMVIVMDDDDQWFIAGRMAAV